MYSVLSEASSRRTAWDACIAALVVVTGLLVPIQVVFQHEAIWLGSLLVYAIDLFFVVDIALNFRTSYRYQGTEITDRALIARRYLRRGLLVDLVATVPLDLLLLLVVPNAHYGGVQVVLLVRLLRLLRLRRLFVIFRRWERLSWTHSGYIRIGRFAAGALLLVHWIACAWFLVPFMSGYPENSWVVMQQLEHADAPTSYLRALYWTVVTMTTVGYGDITPIRNEEYVFAIVVILLGATFYAFIIGNIASSLSNLDSAKAAFWHRADATTQYLRARRVPAELTDHIHEYYEYIWARNRGMNEGEMLGDLPRSMRLDVVAVLTRDLMDAVPLFSNASPALRNVLLRALQPRIYAPGDTIVYEGELGDAVYFVSRGSVEIWTGNGGRSHGTLQSGEYFGDLSLLLGEMRTAGVVACDYTDVFVLSGGDFDRIRTSYQEFRDVLKKVASEKSERLSELTLEGVVL